MLTNYKSFKENMNSDSEEIINTVIISAFPACGKTTFFKENEDKKCTDSDSTNFSWIINDDGEKVRNPEFPQNYIEHIKNCIGKYDYVFVSSHEEVRNLLIENNISFYIVYPEINMKDEYLERYKNRGNDEAFIELLTKNWEVWLQQIEDIDNELVTKIKLNTDLPYLADAIKEYGL